MYSWRLRSVIAALNAAGCGAKVSDVRARTVHDRLSSYRECGCFAIVIRLGGEGEGRGGGGGGEGEGEGEGEEEGGGERTMSILQLRKTSAQSHFSLS